MRHIHYVHQSYHAHHTNQMHVHTLKGGIGNTGRDVFLSTPSKVPHGGLQKSITKPKLKFMLETSSCLLRVEIILTS